VKAPGVRGRSLEFGKAMQNSAERRRCPKCNRKSALQWHSDEYGFGNYCRWEDCDYERIHAR
jgi:hypothetical protein